MKENEIALTDRMEGFLDPSFDYKNYEICFRRWLVSQLDSGNITIDGIRNEFEETKVGVPQGGPLSPFLSNNILNELDRNENRIQV